jgi:hypothetical protein
MVMAVCEARRPIAKPTADQSSRTETISANVLMVVVAPRKEPGEFPGYFVRDRPAGKVVELSD